jgi:hypothetical protein
MRNNAISEEASRIFSSIMLKPEAIWGEVIQININELIRADTLFCYLEDNNIELLTKYHHSDNNYHYVHYEASDMSAHAIVSIFDNNIHIDIQTNIGKYHFFSITKQEVAIIRYESDILAEPEYNKNFIEDTIHREDSAIRQSIASNSTPTIRVLFLYTSSALSMMSYPQTTGIKNEVYRYINEGNESFLNSEINAHLELAYLGPTDYDESSYSWDQVLNHFHSQGDGYIDEVHMLRNKYAADICVLMTNKDNYCGVARDINVTANGAFCMIWPNYVYCGWRYSAIHEIGHLIGCRHNRSIDGTNTPYTYGHGYINCLEGNAWSTIMSYESSCETSNNHRILHWSNPYVYYGSSSTGSVMYENNARVWNERAEAVSNFRLDEANVTLTTNNNNDSALFESYYAKESIITLSGYNTYTGQVVDMRATKQIRIASGTHIQGGVKISSIYSYCTGRTPIPSIYSR